MAKKYDVVIIGAGSAGLAARAEISRRTDNYLVIDHGILGTTCARVGCMPSKVLIEIANTYHKREHFAAMGILGAESVSVDHKEVMKSVRALRDRFVGGVLSGMKKWQDTHFTAKTAKFIDKNTLDLEGETIQADKIIIATGSKPIVPGPWKQYSSYFIDTDSFFELEDLPKRVAVIGLGIIGIELGQALHRLGVEVIAITLDKAIGGLSDPDVQHYAVDIFSKEMDIHFGAAEIVEETPAGLRIKCNDKEWIVDKVFLTMGRAPVLQGLGLENLGVPLDKRGMPNVNPTTMQVENLPVFMAGDANGFRPLLHEAADEGRVAAYNSLAPEVECFQRRTFMAVTFSDPNSAVIGMSHKELTEQGIEFVTGTARFENQGRAMIMRKTQGLVHIYGDKKTGKLLGAELIAPHGEHLAHLLAWTISFEKTAQDVLSRPFYHPVLEEGIRGAFRKIAANTEMPQRAHELLWCGDPPAGG